MELKEVLLKRRSVRKFKETEISDEIINELMHAAMSGPSACNRRPWDFYVVKDKEVLEKVRKASLLGRMKAPLAIVVCGNLSRALPLKMASYWIQDCSAATENILLRVTDLGLGACWCGGHPQKMVEDNLRKCLSLDKNQISLNIIWVGYPDEEVEARDQYEEKCVHII